MMKMRSRLLCVALGVFFGACATRQGFEKAMNDWLWSSESVLIERAGPPQSVYVAPDGTRFLTYARSGNVQFGGGTTYQPVTATTNGNIYGSGGGSATYRSTTTTYQPVQQPVYNVELSCTVTFRVVSDRIGSWRANGNNCVR